MPPPITIANETVASGQKRALEIPVSRLPTGTSLSLPVTILNGRHDGPTIWLSAAVHGDELNGVEIIRRILERIDPNELSGALLAVPVVNVFGFIGQSRYLPDRRDLNRSFPGSARGSLAARLAHLFMTEIVSRCSYGIDLHTGSNHRTNFPHIRANLDDPETRRIATHFGAPGMSNAPTRDGSLRQAASQRGIHVLLYEAGEALRFDETAIRTGVTGTLRVMAKLKMIRHTPKRLSEYRSRPPLEVSSSTWLRARQAGILRLSVDLGETVTERQRVGSIVDVTGDHAAEVLSPHEGIVIGLTRNPLVNRGDGILHITQITQSPPPPDYREL